MLLSDRKPSVVPIIDKDSNKCDNCAVCGEIVFRYGVAETARTTTKTAPEPLCEKSGRMISPIYIIGIGRRPDFRRARNAVRGDSRRPDMPGLRRRQEQFRRGRGAARKARRSPEKERPAAFRRAVSKKSGGGIQSSPIFAIFVRRARCAVKNQINTMMKKILFLMAATAMMWGGVMQ